jgi:hypothetical protein
MREHQSEDVYSSFNLLMRRKPKVRSCTFCSGPCLITHFLAPQLVLLYLPRVSERLFY